MRKSIRIRTEKETEAMIDKANHTMENGRGCETGNRIKKIRLTMWKQASNQAAESTKQVSKPCGGSKRNCCDYLKYLQPDQSSCIECFY